MAIDSAIEAGVPLRASSNLIPLPPYPRTLVLVGAGGPRRFPHEEDLDAVRATAHARRRSRS